MLSSLNNPIDLLYLFWLAIAVGLLGDIFVNPIVKKLHKEVDHTTSTESRLVGIMERALYVLSSFLGHMEFIPLWLAFKITIRWNSWDSKGENQKGPRRLYNIYILGNALSILSTLLSLSLILLLITLF